MMDNKLLSSITDNVYLTLISTHDFLFFSTNEYNAHTTMESIINNYSLIYAFNQRFSDLNINRAASGIKPHYLEDFKKIKIYSTPAYLLGDFRRNNSIWKLKLAGILKAQNSIIQDKIIQWEEDQKVIFTYNSIGESLSFKMEPLRLNFPNLGRQERYPPLTTFICFTIGKRPPNFIRLGKKLSVCRVFSLPLQKISLNLDNYYPHHPVNISEMPPNSRIIEGSMVYMQPASLLINGKLNGQHIRAQIEGSTFNIALPDPQYYPSVFLQ
ncbi:MAG: type I-D CRISPR-associated protein Cas5/Csc1 [Candidatus Helarchaeota archaeon]